MRRAMLFLFTLCLAQVAHADASCPEPYWMAMEIQPWELLPDEQLVQQIDVDLAAIRAFDDYFETILARPHWTAGDMMIKFTDEAHEAILAGTYTGLDALNAIYGPVTWDHLLWNWHMLSFSHCYNIPVLDPIYEASPDVLHAEPNGYIGDGGDIYTTEVGHYTFHMGWGDCPSGCIYGHYWEFVVEAGVVTLVDHWGSPVDDWTSSVPSARIDARLLPNYPNPFNPSTEVRFRLSQPAEISLHIVSLDGRRLRRLEKGVHHEAGDFSRVWDGRNDAGHELPSGIYFAVLEAGNLWDAQKLALIK